MSLVSPLRSQFFAYGSEWYEISDEYDSGLVGFVGDYEYFGYLNTTGAWIIQQHQISTGAWRYVQGSSGYAAAFTGKGALTYGYYNSLTGAGR